jgi:ATP-binding cassette subfamily B protein
MAAYNFAILGIFMLGSVLYVLWIVMFLKYRRKLDFERFDESSSNQSNLVQLVTGMQEIKLNNCEKQKRWEWERIQARLYKISIKSTALGQAQQVGGLFIDQAKNVFISYLAAKSVIDGGMTLGMMMAMQYILGQLNAPIGQFITFVQQAQDAKISLERIGEIYNREDEEPVDSNKIKDIPASANIAFESVSFSYNNVETVLNNIDLSIPAGKITAIVGSSGSGKTTLLKLLLGFYPPKKGKIYLGDKPLALYSEKCWRRNCGIVMQDGYIFSDTVADNIGIVDEIPDNRKVVEASRVANISDFIESLPLQYNTQIGATGNGLSSGQKQRILIARAVYKEPEYIIFDEATNSLDASNEKTIMENMSTFFEGKTVIIVAHRLSTVKNADQIVVLDNGAIAELGTHDQLIEKRGLYYNLVKDQLELGS